MKVHPKFVFVMGTTASGKTDLALRWAQKYQGEIINCDSLQVYAGLDVGTAKPTPAEMQMVPHHLFSFIDYPHEITAGEYLRHFYSVLEKANKNKIYFVVGGTGFYFQALEKGMYPVKKMNLELKAQVEKELQQPRGAQRLFEELRRKDPVYAEQIHEHDHYRLGRGIEIIRAENKSVTEVQREFAKARTPFPFPYLKCGPWLDKEILKNKIQKRTRHMIQQGLVEETQKFIQMGAENWSPLQSVGYRETGQYLREKKSLDWLDEAICTSTAQLAKKQRTWFQRDPEIFWIKEDSGLSEFELKLSEFL